MRVALLLLAGCWTGTAAPPPITETAPAKPPLRLRITLERTYCLGTCPVYTVTVYGDGRVAWNGMDNVAVVGPKQTRIERREVERLSRLVDRAHFFRARSASSTTA